MFREKLLCKIGRENRYRSVCSALMGSEIPDEPVCTAAFPGQQDDRTLRERAGNLKTNGKMEGKMEGT